MATAEHGVAMSHVYIIQGEVDDTSVPEVLNSSGTDVELQYETPHEDQDTTNSGTDIEESPESNVVQDSDLVQAREVEDTEEPNIAGQAEEYHGPSSEDKALDRKKWNTRVTTLCGGSTAIIVGLALVILYGTGLLPLKKGSIEVLATESPSYSPSNFPSLAPTAIVVNLPASTKERITNGEPVYAEAYQWILDDPGLAGYSSKRKQQRFALALLYYATQGGNWQRKDDWLSYNTAISECEWATRWISSVPTDDTYGAGSIVDVCNEDGMLMSLVLSRNGLKGFIPPEIFTLLPDLQVFDVLDNYLSGSLPSEIGLTTDLSDIIIRGNDLTGTLFPTEIGLLTNLYVVLAHTNPEATGRFPSELGLCTNLNTLVISNTKLYGTLPSELGQLKRLATLELSLPGIAGSMPSQFGQLKSLRFFNFAATLLKGDIPTSFGQLSSLEHLSLKDINIKGALPSELWLLTKLTHLAMPLLSLTGTLPSQVGLLTNLEYLDFCCSRQWQQGLSGTLPTELGMLSSLENAFLGRNSFTGSIPTELEAVSSLIALSVTDNKFNGTVPGGLCDLGYLAFDCTEALCGCDCVC